MAEQQEKLRDSIANAARFVERARQYSTITCLLYTSVGQILVVILKSLAGSVKVGLENLIIIVNRHLEKITGTLIQFIGIKTFVL